jgi:uncharacterized phage protein (predicted DNA packaging)
MSITTLAEAKLHLRVDGSEEDTLLQLYLNAAEKAASNQLNRALYATTAGEDADGLVMTDAIKAAVLLLVGHWYANREAVTAVQGTNIRELPLAFSWLIDQERYGMGV